MPSHLVFVDFENVQDVDLAAIGQMPVVVTILLGKNQTKVGTALFTQGVRYAARVLPIQLAASGRNAMDLVLAFHLGRAAIESPSAELHIVSRDKDFDALITHLCTTGIKISRSESFLALPFLPRKPLPAAKTKKAASDKNPAADAGTALATKWAKVIDRLKDPTNRSRPGSEDALLAYLCTCLGKENGDGRAEELFLHLKKTDVLSVEETGKVVYGVNL